MFREMWVRCRLVVRTLILFVGTVAAPAWPGAPGLARAEDEEPTPGLHWYPILSNGLGPAEQAVPRGAVDVFTHEGKPRTVHVGDEGIGVDYGPSGVLFD